jgi:cytochrome c oxidase assembly factor CtaG
MTAVIERLVAPPALLAVIAAVLFAFGNRRHLRMVAPARRDGMWMRSLAFYAALVTTVVALDSPVDDSASRLFWVHMTQHVMLMMIAAPLIVLSAPWMSLWRGLPLAGRRRLAFAYFHSRAWGWARRAGRALASPLWAWVLFNAALCVWHVPALYDSTLRLPVVHDLEHLSFLLLGVVFWAQVIASPPLRRRLEIPAAVAYVTLGATVAWLLSVVLAFAPSPLYAGYVAAHAHSGGLSALTDQQLAAGIMWGPGSIPYALFVFIALYRWLSPLGGPTLATPTDRLNTPGPGLRHHP